MFRCVPLCVHFYVCLDIFFPLRRAGRLPETSDSAAAENMRDHVYCVVSGRTQTDTHAPPSCQVHPCPGSIGLRLLFAEAAANFLSVILNSNSHLFYFHVVFQMKTKDFACELVSMFRTHVPDRKQKCLRRSRAFSYKEQLCHYSLGFLSSGPMMQIQQRIPTISP